MKLKQITAFIAMTATILSPFNMRVNSDVSKPDIISRDISIHNATGTGMQSITDIKTLENTSITWPTAKGDAFNLSLSGKSAYANCQNADFIDIYLYKAGGNSPIAHNSGSTSVMLNTDGVVDEGTIYEILIDYSVDGISQSREWMYIVLTEGDELRFLKSPFYEYNQEMCRELLNDDDSLMDYLNPQNDVQCDNDEIIKIAESIVEADDTDFEKSYKIYDYITNEFAYDWVHYDDNSYPYQDDALTLLRRKIAVCEGLANVYVALCRAVGIPSCVSFGYGDDADKIFKLNRNNLPWSNHAWAMVCLEGEWYSLDLTWDCNSDYDGESKDNASITHYPGTLSWYLVPLEFFSLTHIIYDADTYHSIVSNGKCGENATYSLNRDGVLTIYGEGCLELPESIEGFKYVVFDEDSNITTIGASCFENKDLVTKIILPDTVTRIEDYAFSLCDDLQFVYIPEGVTYIGEGAFYYCPELKVINLPDSVKNVDSWAFDECPHLILTLPSGIPLGLANYDWRPLEVREY